MGLTVDCQISAPLPILMMMERNLPCRIWWVIRSIANGPERLFLIVRGRYQWSPTFVFNCSGPLPTVRNICCKTSRTICYHPYIQWRQIRPFCYRIGYIHIKGTLDKKVFNGQPWWQFQRHTMNRQTPSKPYMDETGDILKERYIHLGSYMAFLQRVSKLSNFYLTMGMKAKHLIEAFDPVRHRPQPLGHRTLTRGLEDRVKWNMGRAGQ